MTTDIRVGVVGTGFIARHFVASLARHEGFRASSVLTRREPASLGSPLDGISTRSLFDLVSRSDVIVECSGDPLWATEVAISAVERDVPLVTMNTEFHITTGSAFVGRGLITEAEGDQPGCLAALHEDAVAMGFDPVAYGNMKGFLNPDPTPEDMAFWGAKQGISLPMVTSFTDGTKVQAEQVLVGNHFGATIAREGMLGAAVEGLDEASRILATEAARLERRLTDFVVDRSLPHGVFLVATHDDAHAASLEYYKMGAGPYYTLIKNNILVHLEILKTVRRVMERGTVLLDNSAKPELSLAGVAKRALRAGESIGSAIGSFDVRGHAVRVADRPSHVPIGLIQNARMVRDIAQGEILTFDHLELPSSMALDLWRTEILPGALGVDKA